MSRDLEGAERILVLPAVNAEPASPADQEPIAIASVTQLKGRGGLFRLDARHSRDPDGEIATYLWRVDGRLTGRRVAVEHRFPLRIRPYRLFLTVTDDDGLAADDRLVLVRLGGNVLFCTDCRTVKDTGLTLLASLRPLARQRPFVRIDGHTDWDGETAYNEDLARDRACAVRAALLPTAGGGQRVEVRSFGERLPTATNLTRVGKSRNRRVEILLDDRAIVEGDDRVTPQVVRC